MKKAILILFMGIFVTNSFAQRARQNCCSCYNFFLDKEVYFIRDSMISYRFDQESSQWRETNFYTYFYDDNQKLKETLLYVTDSENLLRKSFKRYEYEYRKDERDMTRVGYSWDEEWSSWTESTMARHYYDSTFSLSKSVEFTWDPSSEDWTYNYNNQYDRDGKGLSYDSWRAKWDPAQQVWMNDAKTNCSFTPSFDQKTCFSYRWFNDSKEWIPSQKIMDYYDEEGTLQRRIMDVWDQEQSSWEPLRNFYFLYDQYGREIEWLSYGWDDSTGERIGMGRQLYAYDESGNKRETLRYGWNKTLSIWILSGKQVEYWTDLTKSSRIDPVQNEFRIYPNPFEQYATIEIGDYQSINRIEMVDMFGRKVKTLDQVNEPTLTLDRGTLKSGLYFLKVYTTSETITLKVIIK